MATNKRKILENARKLAQKGAKDKALKEYEKLLKLDPKDAKLRLEIGDAHRRWGQVEEAVTTYRKVAEQYMKDGFDARAVAVYKQILNLDAERFDAYEPLAELYERMGLTGEAIAALQTAADGHHKAGDKPAALELLRKMSSIDPTNTTSRIKVAELLRQENMLAEAVTEYEQVAEELERQGDVEAFGNVHKRVLEMDPNRIGSLIALAKSLVSQGQAADAEAPAKRAVEIDDQEPSHFELLADVYRAQGREDLLPTVYRSLADIHRRRGDDDKARDILQRYVPGEALSMDAGGAADDSDFGEDEFLAPPLDEVPPEDELSLDGDTFSKGGTGESLADSSLAGAAFSDPSLEDELDLGPELEIGADGEDELELDEELHAAAASNAEATISGMRPDTRVQPPSAGPSGDADQLLAEASVYLRYGKRDKAIAHLDAILAQDPEHRLALEKLGEAFAEDGNEDRAVELWLQAAKRAEEDGDSDAVGVLRGRIEALDPAAAQGLGGGPETPPPAAPGPDLSLDDDEADEILFDDDDVAEEEASPPPAASDDMDLEFDFDIDDAEPSAVESLDEQSALRARSVPRRSGRGCARGRRRGRHPRWRRRLRKRASARPPPPRSWRTSKRPTSTWSRGSTTKRRRSTSASCPSRRTIRAPWCAWARSPPPAARTREARERTSKRRRRHCRKRTSRSATTRRTRSRTTRRRRAKRRPSRRSTTVISRSRSTTTTISTRRR